MDTTFKTDRYEVRKNDMRNYGLALDNGGNGGGLPALKKGQLVTGTIVSVDEQVTIDISGRKVAAPRNIFYNIRVGDVKTFEVMKVTDQIIELALCDLSDTERRSFKAVIESISNWELVMAQKEQAAKKNMKEEECKHTANKLNDISGRMTEQDYSRLENEGFPVSEMTVDGLYEALDRIKTHKGTKAPLHIKKVKDGLPDKAGLQALLKAENIPDTHDNVSKLMKALALSKEVSALDDKAMKYLIMTDTKPTVENIYKARYSGNTKSKPLSEEQWNELASQAAEIIAEAGYAISEENLNTARWLVDNQIPLTRDTFSYRKELEDIKLNSNFESILGRMLEGMKQGLDPKDVRLSPVKEQSAEKLVQDIAHIQAEAVTEAVHTGTDLTIRNLVKVQEKLDGLQEKDIREADYEPVDLTDERKDNEAGKNDIDYAAEEQFTEIRYKEIKALRQLEEIRLKMTLEAAAALEKKGIKVDTLELSKVVDALRELENSYYEKYFKEANIQASEEDINLLRETTTSIEQLKNVPCYVLGSTLHNRSAETIPQLLEAGNKLISAFDRASAAYETLMTTPNREYGDSIYKAFGNIPSILEELDMDNSEANQRAVRILAYNRMEINEETIRQVKAYDLQVNQLIKNLHPAVAVRMIKEGINPLDMPIYQLNKQIDIIKQNQGISSEEKYSSFLRKLEKAGGISEAERKAYIGIYRLLYNIEKSDGAAIGALVKAGREVTLDNLLSAVMTGKKGKLDAIVNDEFGMLDGVTRDGQAISEQLALFRQNGMAGEKNLSDTDEQIDYYNRIVQNLKDNASPEMFKAVGEAAYKRLSSEQANTLYSDGTDASDAANEIWNLIKDVPIEKLFEQQKNWQNTEPAADELYQDMVKNLRQLGKNAEQSIRFLSDYNIPSTPMNLIYASQILGNGESAFKKLFRLQQDKNVGKIEDNVKEFNNFTDKLIDSQSMPEAYAHLEESVKDRLEELCLRQQADSEIINSFVSLRQQLAFLKTLAEKEFYQIPVMTDRGITDVNLTIVRKAQSFGELWVTSSSEKLGSIKAELILKASDLSGYISCDNRDGLERLKSQTDKLYNAAEENSIEISKLDYVLIKKDAAILNHREEPDQQESKNPETESILYSMAKAILNVISLAESNE